MAYGYLRSATNYNAEEPVSHQKTSAWESTLLEMIYEKVSNHLCEFLEFSVKPRETQQTMRKSIFSHFKWDFKCDGEYVGCSGGGGTRHSGLSPTWYVDQKRFHILFA